MSKVANAIREKYEGEGHPISESSAFSFRQEDPRHLADDRFSNLREVNFQEGLRMDFSQYSEPYYSGLTSATIFPPTSVYRSADTQAQIAESFRRLFVPDRKLTDFPIGLDNLDPYAISSRDELVAAIMISFLRNYFEYNEEIPFPENGNVSALQSRPFDVRSGIKRKGEEVIVRQSCFTLHPHSEGLVPAQLYIPQALADAITVRNSLSDPKVWSRIHTVLDDYLKEEMADDASLFLAFLGYDFDHPPDERDKRVKQMRDEVLQKIHGRRSPLLKFSRTEIGSRCAQIFPLEIDEPRMSLIKDCLDRIGLSKEQPMISMMPVTLYVESIRFTLLNPIFAASARAQTRYADVPMTLSPSFILDHKDWQEFLSTIIADVNPNIVLQYQQTTKNGDLATVVTSTNGGTFYCKRACSNCSFSAFCLEDFQEENSRDDQRKNSGSTNVHFY